MKRKKSKTKSFDKLVEVSEGLQQIQSHFREYQDECFQKRSPEFFCLELNGEAGELANLEKKKWKGLEIDSALLADEAADVLIALMNYVNSRDIDLTQALTSKLHIIEDKRPK